MPVHRDEQVKWFEDKLTELLSEAYTKGVPDEGIVSVLNALLQAHIESAQAVLAVLQDEPDEEEEGGVDYFG